MIPKEMKYNLHYGEVQGDVLPPPHATNTSCIFSKINVKKDCINPYPVSQETRPRNYKTSLPVIKQNHWTMKYRSHYISSFTQTSRYNAKSLDCEMQITMKCIYF